MGIEKIHEHSTDVLVIGGGIAGLCAANKAVDQGVKVLIAEKSTTPWCGQVPTGGGAFHYVTSDRVDTQVKFMVEEGEYLNDQDWTYAYAKGTRPCIDELFEWGVPFQVDINGRLQAVGLGRRRASRPEIFLPTLLRRALHKGATVLNRVDMVDLLTQEGRVVGAVGFHVRTGDFYVIHAKATILASGGCMYKNIRRCHQMNSGEGIAMAYHAGAELRNAEFGNTSVWTDKLTYQGSRGDYRKRDAFENARGEPLVAKYPELNPEPEMPQMLFKRWVRAMYNEIEAGRGPIYLNLPRHPKLAVGWGDGTNVGARTHGYVNMMRKLGIDVTTQKLEWIIAPEFRAGPIRVDLNCQTTLPGLYAVGDAIQNGSSYIGALEGCGLPVPLAFAAVTGFRAGVAAGKAAATTPVAEVNPTVINQKQQELFAPLGVTDGWSPYDAIYAIQEIVFPIKNCFFKHQDRLETALGKIEKIQERLGTLTAKDSHELVSCYIAKSMALNAEALFRASLMRTETRGTNIREDYPERDDTNWLKWILIRKDDGAMRLWTESIPFERYNYKPH